MLNTPVMKELQFTQLELLFVRTMWDDVKHASPSSCVGPIIEYLCERGDVLHTPREIIDGLGLQMGMFWDGRKENCHIHPTTHAAYTFSPSSYKVYCPYTEEETFHTYPLLKDHIDKRPFHCHRQEDGHLFWTVPDCTVGLITTSICWTDFTAMPVSNKRMTVNPTVYAMPTTGLEYQFIGSLVNHLKSSDNMVEPHLEHLYQELCGKFGYWQDVDEVNFTGWQNVPTTASIAKFNYPVANFDTTWFKVGHEIKVDYLEIPCSSGMDTSSNAERISGEYKCRSSDCVIQYTVEVDALGNWRPCTFKYAYFNNCRHGMVPPDLTMLDNRVSSL